MENVSILTAFVFGIISFISPCVLPIVPGYLSFISGYSIDEMLSSARPDLDNLTLISLYELCVFFVAFAVTLFAQGLGSEHAFKPQH